MCWNKLSLVCLSFWLLETQGNRMNSRCKPKAMAWGCHNILSADSEDSKFFKSRSERNVSGFVSSMHLCTQAIHIWERYRPTTMFTTVSDKASMSTQHTHAEHLSATHGLTCLFLYPVNARVWRSHKPGCPWQWFTWVIGSVLFWDMRTSPATHETKSFSLDLIRWKVPTLTCGLSPRFNRQHSQVAEHNVLGFIMEILRHSGGGDGGGRGGARGSHWSDPCQTLRHIRSWRLKLDVLPRGGHNQQVLSLLLHVLNM